MTSVPFCFGPERRLKKLEEELIAERVANASRETLLREEVEKWKSHREWSDRIIRAYLDELARTGR